MRLNSGATPADHLAASMAAEPISRKGQQSQNHVEKRVAKNLVEMGGKITIAYKQTKKVKGVKI